MKNCNKETRISKSIPMFLFGISIFLIAISPVNHQEYDYLAENEPPQQEILRFGITLPYLSGNYIDLVNQINAKAVLDWRTDDKNEWKKDSIDYLHVIRVDDQSYDNGRLLDTLPNLITNNIGEVWIIGNEPDRDIQDGITPEVYAQRYYEIAIRIRYLDPTAKIGFGSIVQPTPIRIRYLERALSYLTYLSCGNRQAALDLIDIWSIHAFILNERGSWGASIPVGFNCPIECFEVEGEECPEYCELAVHITDYSDTYSIDIFAQRIIEFRNWMKTTNEQNKPLWITEYGSLFPDWEIICAPYPDICDEPFNGWPEEADTNEFMLSTFNFLLTSSDSTIGYQEDENRLVQRWFWYSLNDYRNNFGGTLFDPENYFSPTLVGQSFMNYTNEIVSNPISGTTPVIYRQSDQAFQVYFNEVTNSYSYPYQFCFFSQLRLVFK